MANLNSVSIQNIPALIIQESTGGSNYPTEFSLGDESVSTISLQTRRTRLSPTTNNERELTFQNEAYYNSKTYDADGVRPHGCRIYGGNGSSSTGIGIWDNLNSRQIIGYNDVDNKLTLGSNVYEGSTKLSNKYAPMPVYTYSGNLAAVSVASATYTAITSINFSAGTYIIIGHFAFGTNSSGYRKVLCEADSASTGSRNDVTAAAASSANTCLTYSRMISPTSSTTYYFRVYQNSGSTLSVTSNYTIIKVK